MKSRKQRTEIRGQASVKPNPQPSQRRAGLCDSGATKWQSPIANPQSLKRGFTLVELLLATMISVMVFAAMGVLLTRSFTLWMDGTARWRLAQHARVTRSRLLDGGFNVTNRGGAFTGWLSSSGVTFGVSSGEAYVDYCPIQTAGTFRAYGWTNDAAGKNLRLQRDSVWTLGQNVAASDYAASVTVDRFSPRITNGAVVATYRLRLEAMGRTFEQPCTVRAFIVN